MSTAVPQEGKKFQFPIDHSLRLIIRMPYMSDTEAVSSPYNLMKFLLAAFWVPLYREFHFYFAHRFIVSVFLRQNV